MDIVEIAVKDLRPYEKNAKKHDQTQIDNVAKSIEKYGFVQPIVVDKNNEVIIGHCRLEASKKLKLKKVPCVLADTLTEEQVKELRLLDNKLNESDWDFDLLGEELAELDLGDFDLDWGVNLDEDYGTEFTLPNGDKSQFQQITFTLHQNQAELIRGGLDLVEDYEETYGNTNKNGNALYTIVKQWVENRG